VDGTGKLEISRTVAQTAGPAISGGLIELLKAPIAVAVDAVSFLVSGLFVFLIRREEPTPDRHMDEHGQARLSLRHEVAAGLRYVLGNRYLRGIAASTGTANLFGSIAMATYIVYVVRDLGLSPGEIGLVFGLGNIGAIVGAVVASRFTRLLGLGRAIVIAMFLSFPALLLIAIAPKAFPGPFLVASGFLFGLSAVIYNINQVSFRQAITPAAMQGRMNATMRFIVWGAIPLGQILGGVIATTVGVHEAIWIGAIGNGLAVVPLVITPVRTLREMPAPIDDAPTAVDPTAAGGPTPASSEADLELPPVSPIDPPGR